MTVSSWFRSDNGDKVSMKEAAKYVGPPKATTSNLQRNQERFSTLLLEHGERHIQDWSVVAYSSPISSSSSQDPLSMKSSTTTTWAQAETTAKKSRKARKQKQSSLLDKDRYPTVHFSKAKGRLFLCSLSIVFVPADLERPLVRCPLSKLESPPKARHSDGQDASSTGSVELTSLKHSTSSSAISPVDIVPVPTLFRFLFLHSSPSRMVELSQKLLHIIQQAPKNHHVTPELDALLKPMFDRTFDPTNMVDIRERPISSNMRCQLLTPLQSQAGCLLLTEKRLYFQPSSGVLSLEPQKAQSWPFSQLVATARRYSGLQDCALELYWKTGPSTLLALERKHEREHVLRLLPQQGTNIPCHTDRDFVVQASMEWQKGQISNYEYLLLINSAAGRSFQDLSRYPVVPWVLQDYESKVLDLNDPKAYRDLTKPVGALNKERLEYFQKRLESMHDMEDPFLYGTHYSAAGYVLYYLIRSMPEHMLCLQNGKFDTPDRIFHSLQHCFHCVRTNHADVKELIPEFFHDDFDFLINAKGLQLGATQNGDRVNDVSLPPWAKSARDFLKKNRKALESDICTEMLPRWIDLIFGNKSRGDAARKASNLFHPLTYMTPADLSALATPEERFQAELQATEFGIVPDQLFVAPHPLRHETVDDSFVNSDLGRTFCGADDGKGEAWELLDAPIQNDAQMGLDVTGSFEADPSHSELPQHDLTDRDPSALVFEQNPFNVADDYTALRDTDRGDIPLSGSGTDNGRTSGGTGAFSHLSIQPSLSNVSATSAPAITPRVQDMNSSSPPVMGEWVMKMIEQRKLHEDAISGCHIIPEGGSLQRSVMVTTSLDGGLKVNMVSLSGSSDYEEEKHAGGLTGTLSRFSSLAMSRAQAPVDKSKLTEYRSHASRDPLASLAMASDGYGGQVAFAGGHDDVVLAYGINSGCAVASVYSHRDAVTGLDMLSRNQAPETALWLESSTHIMISGSWDATVKVWSVTVANGETVSINREPLAELFDADSSIVCVSTATDSSGRGIVIAAGCADGSFCVWNLHGDGGKSLCPKSPFVSYIPTIMSVSQSLLLLLLEF